MINLALIEDYIQYHKLSWAESTQIAEERRLKTLLPHLELPASQLYQKLLQLGYKPYTIKTCMIRVMCLYEWANLKSDHRNFMRENARLFKHAYVRNKLNVTYDDALTRINNIPDITHRMKAYQLLASGMRYSESKTLQDGKVIGKGGKTRDVFLPEELAAPNFNKSYSAFLKALRKVGLKPHDLRKLAATNFLRNGGDLPSLMHVMGWSSLNTAQIYLQPEANEKISKLLLKGFTRV